MNPDAPNVLQAMMKLEQANARAKRVNKVALEVETEFDNWDLSDHPMQGHHSVCKGIMSCFSFLFLGVPRHYAKRPFSCWYQACSRVRGRGLGSQSSVPHLLVTVCTSTKETAWIVHSHIISRDSESREKGCRYCCEGSEKGQTWRVGVHTGLRSVVK